MNEFLRRRIERKLEGLPDDQAYQILDYIEFLESRYGRGSTSPSPFQRIAETVEDTLRAAKMPVSAIRGTMDAAGAASRMVDGLVAAGRAAVDEITRDAGASEDRSTRRVEGGEDVGARRDNEGGVE